MGKYQDALTTAGTKVAAAKLLGIPVNTFKDRLNKELSGATPEVKTKPSENKLKLYGISDLVEKKSSDWIKIVYFTDAHNQPGMSLDRFKWLAGLVNDVKPDYLISGGDMDEIGSLSGHEKNETYKGKLKPLLAQDLEASAHMAKLLKDEIKHPCQKIITLGNHEQRIKTYENNNPEIFGIAWNIYAEIWQKTGWIMHDYGAYVNIGGVKFTHAPFDQNGGPVKGEACVKKVAVNSTSDCVFGHLHYETRVRAHKFDTDNSVTVLCAACFMPEGYRPDYAKNTRKEYDRGCYVLMVKDGRLQSIKQFAMSELEYLYGH